MPNEKQAGMGQFSVIEVVESGTVKGLARGQTKCSTEGKQFMGEPASLRNAHGFDEQSVALKVA